MNRERIFGLVAGLLIVTGTARAEVYEQRRKSEGSLMARGIYRDAAERSRAIAEPE